MVDAATPMRVEPNANEAMIQGTEPRAAVNTTPTTLEHFAQVVFRSAYEQAATVMR